MLLVINHLPGNELPGKRLSGQASPDPSCAMQMLAGYSVGLPAHGADSAIVDIASLAGPDGGGPGASA